MGLYLEGVHNLTHLPGIKRGFLSDFLSILFGKSFHVILTLLSGVILARTLGPEGKGIVAGILVYPMLFQSLFEGGLRQSAVYFAGKKLNAMEDILGAMVLGYIVTSFLGCVGSYYSISFFMPTKLSWQFVAAISLIVPAQIGISYIKGLLLGIGKINVFSKTTWLPAFFLFSTLLILYIESGLSVQKALFATVSAAYLGFFQAIWYLFKNVPCRFKFNSSVLWNMLRLGCVYALALFSITLNYRIDVALLSAWSTSEEVGIYTVATNFGELLWYLPGVLVPLIFSRSANSNNGTDHIETLVRVVRLGFPASCLLAVLFGAGAFFLIPVFYGIKFQPSSYSLMLLLPGLTAMILFKILNADLAGQGDPLLALYSMVPGVLFNVALNFLLIPQYGAFGAAISSTVSYVLTSFLFLMGYTKKRNIPFDTIFTYRSEDVAWAKNRISVWVGKFKA